MRYESWKRLIFMGQVRSYEIRNAVKGERAKGRKGEGTNGIISPLRPFALSPLSPFRPFTPSPFHPFLPFIFLFAFSERVIIFAFNFKFVFAHDYC